MGNNYGSRVSLLFHLSGSRIKTQWLPVNLKHTKTISQDGNYCIEQVDAVKNRLDNRKKNGY